MPRRVLKPYTPKKRYIPKNKYEEDSVHRKVCTYLRNQYPNVIFRSDYSGVANESVISRTRMSRLQSSRAFPDLFIYHPRKVDGRQYAGMALELKREGTSIFVKIGPRKGKLVAKEHIQEQYHMLQQLEKVGYYADFGIGFDHTISLIDHYMGKPQNAELF